MKVTFKNGLILIILITFITITSKAQDFISNSKITGNFELDGQYYKKDSIIGAQDVRQKMLSNGYLNLNFTSGKFTAGVRYENYTNPPILGFDTQYKGSGIPFRYAEYNGDEVSVTAGNFYEQFGSGMLFRSYQETSLGIDNAMDGLRFKFRPISGIDVTGLIGHQRYYWDVGTGVVRGGDLNISINELFKDFMPVDYNLTLGGSVISKYQADDESYYNLPENVFGYSTRFDLTGNKFKVDGEFAFKNNDPNTLNKFSYNNGTAALLTASYYPEGFGFSINLHRIDNFDFRSDRSATGNSLTLNYFPPMAKQQTYRLATIYPFATKANGEVGLQSELNYAIPKHSFLGGEYGTMININYSRIQSLDTTQIRTITTFRDSTSTDSTVVQYNDVSTYDSPFFKIGKRLYFQDINLEITKKISPKLKTILTYINTYYDKDMLENGGAPKYGHINANLVVMEVDYKFAEKTALRTELQHLWATQSIASTSANPDNVNGNWAMLLGELTFAPSFYISAWDEWNYGNADSDKKLHYLNGSFTYVTGASRVSFTYGRQRGGILCVGGVCRQVPASNGLTFTLNTTF